MGEEEGAHTGASSFTVLYLGKKSETARYGGPFYF